MTTVVTEVEVPFTRFYDPGSADSTWEAESLEALTDGSLSTYVGFDSLDSGHDQGDALWFIVDADDIPTGTVVSIYFAIRARTLRRDDDPEDPYAEYIAYTFFLVPFDGAAGHVVFGDGSAEHKGLEIPVYISPGAEWPSEAGVYLDEDYMAEALTNVEDEGWFAYNETWNSLTGFVAHLRGHGGFRLQLHATQFTGAWEFASASLVFEVANPSMTGVKKTSRVHFTGG